MSAPFGGLAIGGSTDGRAAVVARLAVLDARLRAVDPDWRGLGTLGSPIGTASALDSGVTADGGFADVLGAERNNASSAATAVMAGSIDRPNTGANAAFGSPVDGARVTQDFGPTSLAIEPSAVVDGIGYAHFHDGLDLAAPLGTAVHAAAAGVVIAAGRLSDGAVVVRLRHADGSETSYGHLQPDLAVQEGDSVVAGETLGAIGLTGRTTGPHLHFELKVGGRTVDPAPWIAAGRLPGTVPDAIVDGSDPGTTSTSDLAAFDAVAGRIPYASQIRDAAVTAGVDPLLLASLVRAESGFRADAVSSAGALGLAQLMPANVRSLGVSDPFDPGQNVAAAARYFANNLHLYGRTDLALAAYQAGKGSVARAGGIPASPTTHRYIDRILGFWSGYLNSAGATGEAAS